MNRRSGKNPASGISAGGSRRWLLYTAIAILAAAGILFVATGGLTGVAIARARSALDAREDDRAAQWISWAQRLNGRSAEAQILAARIARRAARFDEMEQHLDKARAFGWDPRRVRRERLLVLAADGQLDGLEGELNKWLADSQGDEREICEAYANGLAKLARYDDAISLLQAWARDFPDDPLPRYRLGRIYQHLDQKDQAAQEYGQSLAIDPKCYLAAYSLARLLSDAKRFDEALPYYQRCTELPHPLAGKVGIAICLKGQGKLDEARHLLEEAVAANQETRIASYKEVGEAMERLLDATELGTLYSAMGDHAKAEPLLRRAVEYNPRDLVARFGLAGALRGLGHAEQAQQQFSIVQTARKALEDARQYFVLVGEHPEDAEARFKLGRILLDYESERMGLFYLRTVLTYNPNHEPTRRLLEEYKNKSSAERLAALGGTAGLPPSPASKSEPAGTTQSNQDKSRTPAGEGADHKLPLLRFVEVTRDSGLDFTYHNGKEAGELAYVETLGGGLAVLDYDRDGWPDLCLPGGGRLGPNRVISGLPTGLWRNVGSMRFQDVSGLAGVAAPRTYTHGVAVGDIDNDGFSDLVITGYGGLQLFHNQGDGTFVDTTLPAGLHDTLWSTSAAWADFNGDGCLDLYVAHYVDWSWKKHPKCPGPLPGTFDICTPRDFDALPDVVYYSNGDGTFRDASREAGLDPGGKSLGVAAADIDNDFDVDLYVATDTTNNFLYVNDGKGKLQEMGFLSGTAVDQGGIPNGSMGVAIFDYNLDGLPDIWVTNYENQIFGLYRNEQHDFFMHVSQAAGIATMGLRFVGFGTVAADLDRDGDEDLVVSNGHMMYGLKNMPGQQESVLLMNDGRGRFEWLKFDPESYFSTGHWGRGLVTSDLDHDGDLDLVFSLSNEPATVVANETGLVNDWVTIRLQGTVSNRDCVGARVVLHTSAHDYLRLVCGGGSYMSQNDHELFWGIPAGADVKGATVYWPSGQVQEMNTIHGPGSYTLIEPAKPAAPLGKP